MSEPTKAPERKYCRAHYRGEPRNPTARHAWRETSRGRDDERGEYRVIECRYCRYCYTVTQST